MLFWEYIFRMARSATTSDAFNAIAEGRRREILSVLSERESTVGDLVGRLGLTQPQVSKHLRVLREVGLVDVREEGRFRWYRLEARPLRSVHEWVCGFERFWDTQLDAIKARAETAAGGSRDKKGG